MDKVATGRPAGSKVVCQPHTPQTHARQMAASGGIGLLAGRGTGGPHRVGVQGRNAGRRCGLLLSVPTCGPAQTKADQLPADLLAAKAVPQHLPARPPEQPEPHPVPPVSLAGNRGCDRGCKARDRVSLSSWLGFWSSFRQALRAVDQIRQGGTPRRRHLQSPNGSSAPSARMALAVRGFGQRSGHQTVAQAGRGEARQHVPDEQRAPRRTVGLDRRSHIRVQRRFRDDGGMPLSSALQIGWRHGPDRHRPGPGHQPGRYPARSPSCHSLCWHRPAASGRF